MLLLLWHSYKDQAIYYLSFSLIFFFTTQHNICIYILYYIRLYYITLYYDILLTTALCSVCIQCSL